MKKVLQYEEQRYFQCDWCLRTQAVTSLSPFDVIGSLEIMLPKTDRGGIEKLTLFGANSSKHN